MYVELVQRHRELLPRPPSLDDFLAWAFQPPQLACPWKNCFTVYSQALSFQHCSWGEADILLWIKCQQLQKQPLSQFFPLG